MLKTINCRRCWSSRYGYKIKKQPFVPPRGWAGNKESESIQFVVVGKNPGHPLPDEIEAFKNKSPHSTLDSKDIDFIHNFAYSVYRDPWSYKYGQSSVYHRKLKEYIVEALVKCDLATRTEAQKNWITKYVWLTDLVKCSTVKESDSIPKEIRHNCLPFLLEEITYFKPKAIIAVGSLAWETLRTIPTIKEFTAHFRHPSNGGYSIHDERFLLQIDQLHGILQKDNSMLLDFYNQHTIKPTNQPNHKRKVESILDIKIEI